MKIVTLTVNTASLNVLERTKRKSHQEQPQPHRSAKFSTSVPPLLSPM